MAGLLYWAVAITIALARLAGSPLLKIPSPRRRRHAQLHHQGRVRGVAIPPAAKFTTGRRPSCLTCRTSSKGAAIPLA